MGSALTTSVERTQTGRQLVVVMIGWNASIWSKGRLLKDVVSMHVESCGKSAPPLERVKSKYLAVSPVMDILSIKDIEMIKDLLIPISLS